MARSIQGLSLLASRTDRHSAVAAGQAGPLQINVAFRRACCECAYEVHHARLDVYFARFANKMVYGVDDSRLYVAARQKLGLEISAPDADRVLMPIESARRNRLRRLRTAGFRRCEGRDCVFAA